MCRWGVALIATVLLGMPWGVAQAAEEAKPETIATVNGKKIASAEFEREYDMYKRRLSAQGTTLPEQYEGQAKSEVLNDMIDRELVFQQSRKKGIKVAPEQVDKEIDAIKQRYSDPKQFEAILAQMNLTEDTLRSQIADRAAIRTYVNQEIGDKITISDADTKTFFDAHPELFQKPEEVHARHILIKVPSDADEKTRADARKKMEALKKRADGGEDFGELAKNNSQDSSAADGGDLGFFPKGRMVAPFETAAFALKNNQISDIVETQFGYHLIQVVDRHEAKAIGYDEVKTRISANLRNEKLAEQLKGHLESLRKDAKIETFLK
jgi:peptidyl-prolyl cis-trans isomerase C